MKKLLIIFAVFFALQAFCLSLINALSFIVDGWIYSYPGLCFIQLLNSLLMYFCFPLLSLRFIQGQKPFQSVGINKMPKTKDIVAIIGICICMFTSIYLFQNINEALPLPSFLNGLKEIMDNLQSSAMATYNTLLNVEELWRLGLTIIVVAVIPAICEEIFFRGWLQTQANRFVNYHIAVWVVAILFAAMHMQYKVFIPQVLMGALFGYVFYYTGSLWSTIIIHFVNNCATVIYTYLDFNNIINIEINSFKYYNYIGVVTTIIIIGLLLFIRKNSKMLIKGYPTGV